MTSDDIIEMMERDEAPFFKHMGELIMVDGFSYLDAEAYIHGKMDDAAEAGNWEEYHYLIQDLHLLEELYA